MARSPIDLPRMQNQPRLRVAVANGPSLVPQDEKVVRKPRKPRKPTAKRAPKPGHAEVAA